MTPLQHFEHIDRLIQQLFAAAPSLDSSLPWQDARQRYFADLAAYWSTSDDGGQTQLIDLRRSQLFAELTLRTSDKTLDEGHAAMLRQCLDHPLPWQRQGLPAATRAQLYRPRLEIGSPHWRATLPGTLVILIGAAEGIPAQPHEHVGKALLCSLAHGIEAFEDLSALHEELCERLDDHVQSQPILDLFVRASDADHARNAQRLRYEWFADDMVEAQARCLLEVQQARFTEAWLQARDHDLQGLTAELQRIGTSLFSRPSKGTLSTRYALLLEKNAPAWLKKASVQGLTQIMQAMQELVVAMQRAAAPGLLDLAQFQQRHALQAWTRARLGETLRQQHQLDLDPDDIQVSVTMARQVGPVFYPNLPSSYIPVVSRPQVGDTVELVTQTQTLVDLALLNVGWLDVDYWLTARVHRKDGSALDALSAAQAKRMVRALNVGSSYPDFVRTHLLDSPAGQWRKAAYASVNRARMRLELAKARHARHLLDDPLEQGYRWAKVVLQYPDSQRRPLVEDNRLSVRQLLIAGQTVQGVLLVIPETPQMQRFLVYTPDAPDRRAWREYPNPRALLRALRAAPALVDYALDCLPLADRARTRALITKGGLVRHLERREITGDFQQARYQAEVRAMLASVDASTNTKLELLGKVAIHGAWLVLDLISLVLPVKAMMVYSFIRAALSVIDGAQALEDGDRINALKHFVEALTRASDGINSISGSTVLRRSIRAMPPTPPLPLPPSYIAKPDIARLHYAIDTPHGEGVYEQRSPYPGLSLYYIRDNEQRYYQVAFDGYRWRAVDPRQPDAYTQVAVKKREDGSWVVDSPVLWYDGLPDLGALFDDCRLERAPQGDAVEGIDGLFESQDQTYLMAGGHALPVRTHLLADHYHLLIPGQPTPTGAAWAILRWQDRQWRIRVRQPGRSSDWLALPARYSVSRGSR